MTTSAGFTTRQAPARLPRVPPMNEGGSAQVPPLLARMFESSRVVPHPRRNSDPDEIFSRLLRK